MSDLPLVAPGVYVEEASTGERMIHGAPTSITAFMGRAERGPVNEPVVIRDEADYDRIFGGLWTHSTMSYSIRHYFENGGRDAVVVRVCNDAITATFEFPGRTGSLVLKAASPGSWANNLELEVDHETTFSNNDVAFNLTVREVVDGKTIVEEVFRNLSTDRENRHYVGWVLEQQSAMLQVTGDVPTGRPDAGPPADRSDGSDGKDIGYAQTAAPELEKREEGLWALEKAEIFNLLCIPPFSSDTDVDIETWTAAQSYCRNNCAFLIIDPPLSWARPSDAVVGNDLAGAVPARSRDAAVYFPRVRFANPLNGNKVETYAPCGLVAGIYARTDSRRGVWKAPAGKEAKLVGVDGLAYEMTDDENDILNSLGVNCIRSLSDNGCVLWGSRTTEGVDHIASEWKYVSVRRLALFILQSIQRGTLWVIFEPNDGALYAEIRSHVCSFMANLFRQGAFAGAMPDDTYLVRCGTDTTTENDVREGIINVEVGFAPLRPREFLLMTFSLYRHY